MKIRNGFVSNSSSSSFIIGYKGDFHNIVPKALEQMLKEFDLYSTKNVHMLTAKVQEKTYENLSEFKRTVISGLQSQADWWFRPLSEDEKETRKKWEEEDPESYKEQFERMDAIRKNPILVAEQEMQDPSLDLFFGEKLIKAQEYLKEGYKVCTFDLEHDGDYPDEEKYPFHRDLKRLTHELCHKIGQKYDCGDAIIKTNKVELKKLY